uniref:Uncharacterized protein n=1 Tax=Strigamia maritima TaxID=126957 RepID=T1IK27_STRMM
MLCPRSCPLSVYVFSLNPIVQKTFHSDALCGGLCFNDCLIHGAREFFFPFFNYVKVLCNYRKV